MAETLQDLGTLDAYYLPEGCPSDLPGRREITHHEGWGFKVAVRTFYPAPEAVRQISAYLRQQQRAAEKIKVMDRIAALDALAQDWLGPTSPEQRRLIGAIAAVTGFSPAMVEHALYLEQASSQAAHLKRALTQELGSVAMLDTWVSNPLLGGRSRAFGPQLVGAVCSANIPGLPHLEAMRALLVKAACLAKVSRGEPLFLAAWARELAALAPPLAQTVAVIALDREDGAGRAAFVGASDHLVAYGGATAISALQSEAQAWQRGERPHSSSPSQLPLRTTWHGHRLGASLIARQALTAPGITALAERVAYDFSLFDQEACLCPAVLYLEEGGHTSAREFSRALAEAMDSWSQKLPHRELTLDEAMARRKWLDWRMMTGAEVIAAPRDLRYVVTVDEDPTFGPNAPGRLVRVVPVANLSMALEAMAPHRRWLQCAAIAAPDDRMEALTQELGRLGVSRITRPGLMGLPSMMWRHDGEPCLSGLVRFCDEELVPPAENRVTPNQEPPRQPLVRAEGASPSLVARR